MLLQQTPFPQLPAGGGLNLKTRAFGVFESHLLLLLLQVTDKPVHK